MKITRRRNNKKLLLALTALILLAAAGGAAYYYRTNQKKDETKTTESSKVNYSKPTDGQTSASAQAKKEFQDKQTEASQQQAAATGKTQDTTPTTVSVQIPSRSVAPSATTVSSIIDTIDSAGTCTLTLERAGSAKITATAQTQTMGSYSTCSNFNLNLTNVQKGDWQVTIEYKGSASQSGKATKVITLE